MYTVIRCPTYELSLLNCAIVNEFDFVGKHININGYYFTPKYDPIMPEKTVALNLYQRKWIGITEGARINITPCVIDAILKTVLIEINIHNSSKTQQTSQQTCQYGVDRANDCIDCDLLAIDFLDRFTDHVVMYGQVFIIYHANRYLSLSVKHIDTNDVARLAKDTIVRFESRCVNLSGKCRQNTCLINPQWNFDEMGIGGLDEQFSSIFRRAFTSRIFPPDVVEQLGMKHCRGMLLYGPPGTGKTLMARQIGKMLNSREPKIVNGPQILNKYIGESESNIRNLFVDAEEEEKRMGPNSGLHIIIFDEIDAICKSRGSSTNSNSVQDTVVNQLLSKIDGINQLNNVLIIGMTNRRDMLDDALLRPGRLEIQIEINLPDESGRVQILKIHTSKMRKNGKLSTDVDINELASKTQNFSGAELEGLVRAATSIAMNRLVTHKGSNVLDVLDIDLLKVTMCDFQNALLHDVMPAFGNRGNSRNYDDSNVIVWSETIANIIGDIKLLISQTRNSTPLVTILLEGDPGSGKTTMACHMANQTDFPFIRLCFPKDMIGYNENAKIQFLKKTFEDAYKSRVSCIVLDCIERIMDYTDIGPRFSNMVLQTLLVLLNELPPHDHKLLVIVTTSCKYILKHMHMLSVFTKIINMPNLSRPEHVLACLIQSDTFPDQLIDIQTGMTQNRQICIGIKRLLSIIDFSKQIPEPETRLNRFLSDIYVQQH